MAQSNYINRKSQNTIYKPTNIVDLMNRAKQDQKKEKRNTVLLAAAAISALAVTGLIISH